MPLASQKRKSDFLALRQRCRLCKFQVRSQNLVYGAATRQRLYTALRRIEIPFDERFAFVQIDCDLYQPAKAALEYFYPRMSHGGLIVVHDLATGRWPGISQAVNEFLADKPESLVLMPDTSGSAAIVRQRLT
jgi:Macrocin-O-methyltransferase (TylF)